MCKAGGEYTSSRPTVTMHSDWQIVYFMLFETCLSTAQIGLSIKHSVNMRND